MCTGDYAGQPQNARHCARSDWRAGPAVRRTTGRKRSQGGLSRAQVVWIFADVLNVLDKRVNDIDYCYASLLKGQTSPVDTNFAPTGINDHHLHPAEPRTMRVGVTGNSEWARPKRMQGYIGARPRPTNWPCLRKC